MIFFVRFPINQLHIFWSDSKHYFNKVTWCTIMNKQRPGHSTLVCPEFNNDKFDYAIHNWQESYLSFALYWQVLQSHNVVISHTRTVCHFLKTLLNNSWTWLETGSHTLSHTHTKATAFFLLGSRNYKKCILKFKADNHIIIYSCCCALTSSQ